MIGPAGRNPGRALGGGNGVVLGLERLVDDERIHDEYLPRRCRQAARALVEVLEVGGFEAEKPARIAVVTRSQLHGIAISGVFNGQIHDRVS